MVLLEIGNNDSSVKQRSKGCGNSNWSAINIAAMVGSFLIFWPLGLFMVYWICTGRNALELPELVKNQVQRFKGQSLSSSGNGSDNSMFNEYQQTQYDRIREIKQEIQERSKRFHAFRDEQKRKKDEEEFNLFMTLSPGKSES